MDLPWQDDDPRTWSLLRQLQSQGVKVEEACAVPINVVLFCPSCKKQHVDEGVWATRPHRTHQCVDDCMGPGCGEAFTPSAHRTFGVVYDQVASEIGPLDEPTVPSGAQTFVQGRPVMARSR